MLPRCIPVTCHVGTQRVKEYTLLILNLGATWERAVKATHRLLNPRENLVTKLTRHGWP